MQERFHRSLQRQLTLVKRRDRTDQQYGNLPRNPTLFKSVVPSGSFDQFSNEHMHRHDDRQRHAQQSS